MWVIFQRGLVRFVLAVQDGSTIGRCLGVCEMQLPYPARSNRPRPRLRSLDKPPQGEQICRRCEILRDGEPELPRNKRSDLHMQSNIVRISPHSPGGQSVCSRNRHDEVELVTTCRDAISYPKLHPYRVF